MSFTKTHILPLLIIALSTTAFAAPAKPDYSETDSIRINKHSFSPEKTNLADSVINFGKLFLNTPYRYGSAGTNSFDCSGFTSYVYKNFGVDLERSSYDQSTQFPVVEKHEIKPGDLVFYEGRRRNGRVGHVGIVTEIKDNGEFDFIHASVNRGVIITNSAEDYYSKRFVRAGRVMENDSILKVMSLSNLNRAEYVSKNPSQSVKKVIPAKDHYVKKGETLSGIASNTG
jgi:cell wall-associated NlpC family hydrolase